MKGWWWVVRHRGLTICLNDGQRVRCPRIWFTYRLVRYRMKEKCNATADAG